MDQCVLHPVDQDSSGAWPACRLWLLNTRGVSVVVRGRVERAVCEWAIVPCLVCGQSVPFDMDETSTSQKKSIPPLKN